MFYSFKRATASWSSALTKSAFTVNGVMPATIMGGLPSKRENGEFAIALTIKQVSFARRTDQRYELTES
jgi:hypothetical protein